MRRTRAFAKAWLRTEIEGVGIGAIEELAWSVGEAIWGRSARGRHKRGSGPSRARVSMPVRIGCVDGSGQTSRAGGCSGMRTRCSLAHSVLTVRVPSPRRRPASGASPRERASSSKGHMGDVQRTALSLDGERAVTASADTIARLRQAAYRGDRFATTSGQAAPGRRRLTAGSHSPRREIVWAVQRNLV
jgi:hypothetical protein